MNKKNQFTLISLIKCLDQNQLIEIRSKNIPLFFGTIFEFKKLKDFEYKGLSSILIHKLSIDKKDNNDFVKIILNFYNDFNIFSKNSSIDK